MDMMWYRRRGLMVTPHIERVTGAIASFNSDYNKIPVKSLICNIEPIQEGSGDPSPDNVRPISGRTGLSVVRSGKNLLDTRTVSSGKGLTITKNADGSIHVTGTPTGTWIDLSSAYDHYIPTGSYILSLQSEIPCNFVLYSIYEGNTDRFTNVITNGQKSKAVSFARNVDRIFIGLSGLNTSTAYDFTIYPQLELGSSISDYEPYKGSTYSVNWESEAGTVYGATLDVVSGKLILDWYSIPTNSWKKTRQNNGFICYRSDNNPPRPTNATVLCNMVSKYGSFSSTNMTENIIQIASSRPNTLLFIALDETVDISELQLIYKTSDPAEIQLTPQEVKTLLGANNIWCDSGDVTVDYWKWGN